MIDSTTLSLRKESKAERPKPTVSSTPSARRPRWTPTSTLSARSSVAQPTIFLMTIRPLSRAPTRIRWTSSGAGDFVSLSATNSIPSCSPTHARHRPLGAAARARRGLLALELLSSALSPEEAPSRRCPAPHGLQRRQQHCRHRCRRRRRRTPSRRCRGRPLRPSEAHRRAATCPAQGCRARRAPTRVRRNAPFAHSPSGSRQR